MPTKLLVLAATGVAGLVLGVGAGLGAAALGDGEEAPPPLTAPTTEFGSMDEMHAAMRARMPAGLAEQCDAMHAAMPEGMRSMDPALMGSMMGDHLGGALHHP